jgi:hypothetical protein
MKNSMIEKEVQQSNDKQNKQVCKQTDRKSECHSINSSVMYVHFNRWVSGGINLTRCLPTMVSLKRVSLLSDDGNI